MVFHPLYLGLSNPAQDAGSSPPGWWNILRFGGSPSLNRLICHDYILGGWNNPSYIYSINHQGPLTWLTWLTWLTDPFQQTFCQATFRNFPRSGKTPKRSRPTTDRPATARACFGDFVGSCWWVNPIPRGGDPIFPINVERKIPLIFDRWKRKQHTTSMAAWLTDFIGEKWCLSILLVQKNVLSKSPTLLLL